MFLLSHFSKKLKPNDPIRGVKRRGKVADMEANLAAAVRNYVQGGLYENRLDFLRSVQHLLASFNR